MKNKSIFCQAMFAKSSHSLTKLRMAHGPAGLGVYMCVLEALFDEPEAMLPCDYDAIAFRFNLSAETVRSVVEDFGLFEIDRDSEQFYSELLRAERLPRKKKEKNPVSEVTQSAEPAVSPEQQPGQSEIVVLPPVYQDPTMKPLPPLTYNQKIALETERFSQLTAKVRIDLLRQDPEWLKYCALDYRIDNDTLLDFLDEYEEICTKNKVLHYTIFDLKYKFSLWLGPKTRSEQDY